MTLRTRRSTMLLALALLSAGCTLSGSPTPPAATPSAPVLISRASPSPIASPSPSPGRSAPSPPVSPTVAAIARLEAAVSADAADESAQRDLGFALLQRIRETADPSLYAPAGAAFEAARRLAPDDALVLAGIGGLQLGKHEFGDALATGRTSIALSPGLASAHAVVVDALVELGRYDEAARAADEMLAVQSDLSTLSRVSYLAELQGKLDVAVSATRLAITTPGLAPENVAFAESLLGNLLVYTGDRAGAGAAYDRALALVPAHAPSLAGKGRLAVGAARLDEATGYFQRAADILPLPDYVIALADTETAAGLPDDAARNIKLARAEIGLFGSTGVVVDLDLALFEADHGNPAAALGYAQTAARATPTVRAEDALAWAMHRLGRDTEARAHSDAALKLGSVDPTFRYHHGAILAALGEAAAARRDLEMALATDPGFSATGAAEARRILASLPD
ncbi:MAG: tetratricopeptide repeat protein [Chloroflexota bacterium]